MRRLLALLALATVGALPVAASAQEREWTVLQVGEYHGSEAPAQPGDGWLALKVIDGQWHLVAARVTSTPIADPLLGPPDLTGLSVQADVADSLVLLRVPGLVAGKVDTPDMRFKGNTRLFHHHTSLPVVFKGRQYRFEVPGKTLVLRQGSTSQAFAEDVGDGGSDLSLALVWAGDLDRDGQLDFLLASTATNSEGLCLYLSRGHSPHDLVHGAGCLAQTGC